MISLPFNIFYLSLTMTLAVIGQFAAVDATREVRPQQRHCDRDFCDDVVTKCTANRRCSGNFKHVTHRKECVDCLEEKFGKCCGCIDRLCPADEYQTHSSHVGDIADSSYDELFNVLTETDDIHGRWTVANGSSFKLIDHPELGKLRVGLDEKNKRLVLSPSSNEQKLGADYEGDFEEDSNLDSRQPSTCVVAFINKQLGMSQCKRYCRSMGASSFRWFHEGCCECVGKSCIHYGLAQPKCLIDFEL
uniref:Protein twisted gastrulation n=1 Tax=Aceria tosichella TaxID=561515 RepID=A0A6G1SFU7_9ACAR